jgi:nicotinamide riboside kinase
VPPELINHCVTPAMTLVMANDMPWQDDGVRIQRDDAARDRFRSCLIDRLEHASILWADVGGDGDARFHNALAAIGANAHADSGSARC